MSFQHATLVLLLLYGLVALSLNALLRRRAPTGDHLLHTSRELSVFVTSLSFLAANCSALEVLSIIAVAAKYGMLAVHFYWIGAIPALALLVLVFLPRFQQRNIRSVPGFLGERFGASTRTVSALALVLLVVSIGGVTLGLLARVVALATGGSLAAGIWSSALLAIAFLSLGGLSAVLYAEAIQVLLLVLVLIPLTWHILHTGSGLAGVLHALPAGARHPFAGLPLVSPGGMSDVTGVVGGLGLVLGCTYWCSDFLLIQRLHATRQGSGAQLTPLFTMVCKLLLPLVLVLPGLWLRERLSHSPASYDLLLPRLLMNSYSHLLAASAVAVLATSLFFGLCGNVAAGAAVGTADLLVPVLRRRHDVLTAGRWLTIALVCLCIPGAFLSLHSNAVMESVQLALSSFNVPVAVVFLAGVLSTRWTTVAATPAILTGTCCGLAVWIFAPAWHAGSGLQVSFYAALAGGFATLGTLCAVSVTTSTPRGPAPGVQARPQTTWIGRLAALIALACMIALYWVFW